jgi:hypothetical protein
MNAIEILATITAAAILLKVIVLLANPKKFMRIGARLFSRKLGLLQAMYFLLALVTGYFVLKNVPIATILAVALFVALAIKFTISLYGQELNDFVKQMAKEPKAFLKRAWLPIIFWSVMALWALYVLYCA